MLLQRKVKTLCRSMTASTQVRFHHLSCTTFFCGWGSRKLHLLLMWRRRLLILKSFRKKGLRFGWAFKFCCGWSSCLLILSCVWIELFTVSPEYNHSIPLYVDDLASGKQTDESAYKLHLKARTSMSAVCLTRESGSLITKLREIRERVRPGFLEWAVT